MNRCIFIHTTEHPDGDEIFGKLQTGLSRWEPAFGLSTSDLEEMIPRGFKRKCLPREICGGRSEGREEGGWILLIPARKHRRLHKLYLAFGEIGRRRRLLRAFDRGMRRVS